jgi:protein O-mannosyl-transferase
MGKARSKKRSRIQDPSDPLAALPAWGKFLVRPAPAFVLLIGFALLVNMNVLANGLGWDDENIIPHLNASRPLWTYLFPDVDAFTEKSSHPYFRPMISFSYHLDHLLWGAAPYGFHLSVLITHGINTALIFILVRLLLGPATAPRVFLPFLTAALFAVHPAHSEAVAWIAGRNDALCTTFVLLSLIFYLSFRRNGRKILWAGSMFSFYLALLTKELAVGLVLLFPLYEFLNRKPKPGDPPLSPERGADGPARRVEYSPLACSFFPFLIVGFYFWLRSSVRLKPLGGMTAHGDVGLLSIVFDATVATGFYLKTMLFPYPYKPFIPALPESTAAFVLSGVAVLGLVAVMAWAVSRRHVVVAMGLGWTFFLLAPALPVAVFGIAAAPAAERYVYAPSAGFLMAGGWLFFRGIERWTLARGIPRDRLWKGMAMAMAVLLLVFSYESRSRNAVWKDAITFWEAAVAVPPDDAKPKSIAHLKLGLAYRGEGRLKEAKAQYEKALSINPDYGLAHNNLGNIYQEIRDFESAVSHFQTAISVDPDNFMPYFNLGHALGRQNRHEEAIEAYQNALARNPRFARAYNNLGNELAGQGRHPEAVEAYRQALRIDPDYTRARFNFGLTLIEMDKLDEAAAQFEAAIRLKPDYAKAYYNLGVVHYRKKNFDEARKQFGKALEMDKDFDEARRELDRLERFP